MTAQTEDKRFYQWNELNEAEELAREFHSDLLKEYGEVCKHCLQAATYLMTVPGKRRNERDMTVSMWFLQRSLNDLRAVWLLTQAGRALQAGSVAGALFENTLMIPALAFHPEDRAQALFNHPQGGKRWDARQLSKWAAELDSKLLREQYNSEYADAYYKWYRWMCNIKHPTIQGSLHDKSHRKSELYDSVTTNAFSALPQFDEDVDLKKVLIFKSVVLVGKAVSAFAYGLEITPLDTDQALDRLRNAAIAGYNFEISKFEELLNKIAIEVQNLYPKLPIRLYRER